LFFKAVTDGYGTNKGPLGHKIIVVTNGKFSLGDDSSAFERFTSGIHNLMIMSKTMQGYMLDKLLKTRYPLTYYLIRQQEFVKVFSPTPSNECSTSSGRLISTLQVPSEV
jgi:hypothetical protein